MQHQIITEVISVHFSYRARDDKTAETKTLSRTFEKNGRVRDGTNTEPVSSRGVLSKDFKFFELGRPCNLSLIRLKAPQVLHET